MKVYEKPKLIAMSLSGNNMLCNTCDIDVIGDNANTEFLEIVGDFFNSSTFAEYEDCATKVDIKGYCKFTGGNNNDLVIINS